MSQRKITKIQYKGEKLTIQWEKRGSNGEWDLHSLVSKTEPHPDFVAALRKLDKPQAVECELPLAEEEYARHDIQGVSLSYEELDEPLDGLVEVMSATITSLRRMDNADSPMTVNSPHKPETSQVGREMEPQTSDAIYTLMKEAQLFLDGKRHDLFSTKSEMTPTGSEV